MRKVMAAVCRTLFVLASSAWLSCGSNAEKGTHLGASAGATGGGEASATGSSTSDSGGATGSTGSIDGSSSASSGGASGSVDGTVIIPLSDAGFPDGTAGRCPGTKGCVPGCVSSGEEVCDGMDNDCDGIVDDRDVNSDGVCDCLLIATLGVPGTWGQGDVFASWLDARSDIPATSLNDAMLTPDVLSKYEVIVVQDVEKIGRAYSADEVSALAAWVMNGGGLMTLIGYSQNSDLTNINALLAPFGLDYGSTPILPKRGGMTVPITMWNPHPISNGITAVGVDNGYPVEGMGTVVATSGDYVIGMAVDFGKGHVFAWADEWITYDSEWQTRTDYQLELFWVNSIKWLTPSNMCQVPIPISVH